MNNNIKIFYNNIDLFSGIAPIPFISIDQDFVNFNTGFNQITKMSMEGQLTGRYLGNLSYYEITSGFNLLLNRLSNNYGSLSITENNEILFSGDNVILDSITTEDSSWYGILPFTINFEIYETGLFNIFYGVVDPEENIDFSEDDGFITNLTHTISARGLKTGNLNAIESAKNWVKTRTGNWNKIVPAFIKTGNGSNFFLNSSKESIDRFNGSYKLENSYIKSTSLESPKNAILNYSLDLSSGIDDGLVTVNLDGSFKNNIVTGLNSLRSGYVDYNFYNIANEAAFKTFGITLNTKPIKQSINEELNNNTLSFNLIYNNDLLPNIINDYTITIDTDPIKNISNVSLSAKLSAKYGDIDTRWGLVQNYYTGNFNGYNLAKTEYAKESNRILYPNLLTESVTYNQYAGEIDYNASWSDKKQGFSENVLQLTSSVTYTPSVPIFVSNTSTTTAREHNIQNINCATRAVLDISVSSTAKPDKNINFAINDAISEINRIKNIYNMSNSLLLDRKVTQNNSSKTYSITEKYNFKGTILT